MVLSFESTVAGCQSVFHNTVRGATRRLRRGISHDYDARTFLALNTKTRQQRYIYSILYSTSPSKLPLHVREVVRPQSYDITRCKRGPPVVIWLPRPTSCDRRKRSEYRDHPEAYVSGDKAEIKVRELPASCMTSNLGTSIAVYAVVYWQ